MNQGKPVLACCGFRCDLCLAYQPNFEANPTNRDIKTEGWLNYFDIHIPPEEIHCLGCLPEEPSMDSSCPVRPCVISRGYNTCAQCGEYICLHMAEPIVICSEIQQQIGEDIPLEDYFLFILPYENKPLLEAVRIVLLGGIA